MTTLLNNFHFLRPMWWIALIPALLVLYAIQRKKDPTDAYKKFIAPHLLAHLTVGRNLQNRLSPVILLSVLWFFTIAALAGPTFQKEPSPFSEETSATMIALKVTDSMLGTDIQPSRLTRSCQKIKNLLEQRPGSKTGLVAFSGSAHLVMPLTTDPNVITALAGELTPEIMPREGDDIAGALALCNQWLEKSGGIGSILLILDDISPDHTESLKRFRSQSKTAVHIFAVAGSRDAGFSPSNLKRAAGELDATLTIVTANDNDVRQLNSNIEARFSAALAQDESSRWKDAGYFLTPLIALLGLFWFRQGWVIKWE